MAAIQFDETFFAGLLAEPQRRPTRRPHFDLSKLGSKALTAVLRQDSIPAKVRKVAAAFQQLSDEAGHTQAQHLPGGFKVSR